MDLSSKKPLKIEIVKLIYLIPAMTGLFVASLSIGLMIGSKLRSRSTNQKLGRLISKLGMDFDTAELKKLDSSLAALETLTERATMMISQTSLETISLHKALDALDRGIIILDVGYREVLKNKQMDTLSRNLSLQVQVEKFIDEYKSNQEDNFSKKIEVFGPPRESYLLRASVLTNAARILGVLITVENVTKEQQLEEIRRDLVANISHELKTPIGALEILAETVEDENDPIVIKHLVTRIGKEAIRAGKIINSLLDLATLEAQIPKDFEIIEITPVIYDVLERAKNYAEDSGIKIQIEYPEEKLLVKGSKSILGNAIYNLVDNAIKYSEPGNEVVIRLKREGDRIIIEVQDHGIGIPLSDQERIFERFYRVDKTRTKDGGGAGLGLSIVKHAVANHTGEIKVTSTEGQGSLFAISLPLAQEY